MKLGNGEKSTVRDMTNGPILKQMVLFALPLMLGNVFQMLYNTVDSIIVGNFVSKQALAAIGSTTIIVNLLVFFFAGFSIGASVIIGQSFGARNMQHLHDAIHTTMAATFLLSILLTVLGLILVKPLLILMRTPDDVFADATLYLSIYIGGISGLLIYNMGSGILRAVGDSTRPLYFLMLTSVLNIVLDLFFVLVLKAGIAGAAIATILSQFVSAGLTLRLLTRTKDIYRLNLCRGYARRAAGGDHLDLQHFRAGIHQCVRLKCHGGLEQLQQAGSVHSAADAEHGNGIHHLCQPEHRRG